MLNKNFLRRFTPKMRSRRSRLHEQLEDRVLFDAVPDLNGEQLQNIAEDPFAPTVDVSAEHSVNSATAAEQVPAQTLRELVFVDTSVDGYELLVADLVITNQAEVFFLNADTDGLSQIAEQMLGLQNVAAVHIISHGDQAELTLGSATLTSESITGEYADELAVISAAMSDDADLLIYGCKFGEGAAGQLAAQTLANATGADVAASTDLTGNDVLGGDWDLELRTGAVEARVLASARFAGVLNVEATESIVTVQDAEASGAGTVSLSSNAAPLAVTTSGTPFRVGQMLERVWQYDETGDVGGASFVFDLSGIAGINGTTAADFGIIISDTSDLSGTDTITLVASGYDATNSLIYFHNVDLEPNDYFGLATEVVADNFSIFPTASGQEDTAIDLGLTLNPALTDGGTLRDIIGTAIGYRDDLAGTTPTEFLIPAGTTGIKITGYSTLPSGTSANDTQNDDYQSLNVTINLTDETSAGFIAHLVDQGPSRSDQFGWSDAPLGTSVLTGGGTVTGDANDNIDPTFTIVDGKLQITENHLLQTAYHVDFLTNATSSAEFISTASAVREDGDQGDISLAIPTNADFLVLNIADAATSTDAHVEYKGNSRIVIDLSTLTASGNVAAQRGETDDRVLTYAFEDYDVSGVAVGSVLSSGATVIGDSQEAADLLNDSQIYVSGGNLIINRNDTFASSFNSLVTAEFYERKDVGSSAELLGEATDYQYWDTATSNPTSQLTFDIPANATFGIMNLSLNGTNTNNTNENMGAGFAVIDLTTGKTSGTFYMVRASNIVDFVAWNDTDFDTVFFQDPNSISNHTVITQFNDRHAGNAEFVLNGAGDQLILQSTSNRGDQSYLDYYAGGQVQWYGSAPFELTGFPVGGIFNTGSLNTSTGNWDLTIEDALANGLFFQPDEHISGNQPIDVTIRIGDESDSTVVRVEAVIDPITFDAVDACGDEDTDIAIDANVAPTFVDQDGSETVTAVRLGNLTIGHTVSDGTNSFTATAGNQSLDITGWDRTALTYRALPDEVGTFAVDLEVDWQDVGGGVTDTDSTSTTFDVVVKPVNDPPVAVDDNYLTLQDDPVVATLADGLVFNDTDPENDTLSVSLVSGPSNGVLSLNSDGTFTYTPTSGFIGDDSFDYQVSDGNGGFDTATAYIKISPKVEGPLDAIDDTDATNEETTVNIDVYDNDDLPTSGSFSITSTTAPANGMVTVLPDGTIDYTPDTNFFGTDSFTYTLTDAIGRTDTATVTVTVVNTQDPPVATADSGSTPEDTTLEDIPVLDNDTDPDGDPLTVTSATAPNGTVVINGDGTIDYTPDMDFTGTDTVTYTISDGNGGTDTTTVLINVVPVADPPTSADNDVTVVEDSEYVFVASDFAFADGDPGDVLTTIRIDSVPADGQLTFAGVAVVAGQVISLSDVNAGRLAFRPEPDEFGNSYTTFDFSVSDGALFQVSPNTMTVHVTPVQDAPVATNNAITVAEESTGNALGLALPTDLDGDTLTAAVTGLPSVGTVTLANGTIVNNGDTLTMAELTSLLYDAPTEFTVAAAGSFTYDVSDGTDTDSGEVVFTITPINDPPLIDLNGPGDAGDDHSDTFTEGGASVGITDPDVDLTDVDDTDAQLLQVQVGGLMDVGDEFLNIDGTDFDLSVSSNVTATISGTSFLIAYDSGTQTFTITASVVSNNMPITAIEALLAATAYRNDSPLPTVGDRTFDILAEDPSGAATNVPTATISVVRSSQVAEWALTGSSSVIDGNNASYALTLSAELRNGETAFVDLTLADIDTNSSDYASFSTSVSNAIAAYAGPGSFTWVGNTLTFTSDGTGPMAPLNISLTTTPDGIFEGDEDFGISLSGPGSSTGETISLSANDEVVTTIEDNDSPITVSIGDASAAEGSPVEFTISMDYASFQDIVLDLAVTSGSATAGTDFETTSFEYFDGSTWVAATNGTEITIPAGDTSLQVRIDTTPEGLVEVDETFTLSATVLSGSVNDASDTGTGTIIDDDVPAISIDDVIVDEDNGTMTFTVSLDQAPAKAASTVDWATSNGTATGADYTSASGSLSFAIGETTKTVTVAIANDSLYEQSETLNVDLTNAGGATILDNQGVGTIIDDGTGPNGTDDDRPALAVDNVTVTEDIDLFAVFDITLSNPSALATVVSLALNDVSATSGSDYGPTLEFFDGTGWQPLVGDLTIPANTTTVQVRTAVLDDAVIDDGETFTLVATTVSGITTNASDTGIGTIVDDPTPDDTTVEITGPGSVTEGSSATYTISIDNVPLTDVTVTFTYSGSATGGTDYAGVATVTIPAGTTSASFTVNTIDDLLGEPLENFTVTIETITGGSLENTVISATDDSVTTNIIDDDVPVVSVTSVVVTEGFDPYAEFTVELSNATFEAIDFSLTAVGTGANPATGEDSGSTPFDFGTLGADDLEVFDGSVWVPVTSTSIAAGSTSVRLRTAINDDAFLDDAETFTVTATVTGGTTVNSAGSGVGTILDDPTDPEVVLLSLVGPVTVTEGSATTDYTLSLTEFAAEDVVVTLGYSGPATDGSDYGSVATVTILAGTNFATFTLPTVDDSIYEVSEDIVVTIDSVTGGGFESLSIDPAANTVTTAITDVADIPTVSVNDVTAIEGTDDYAIYTIEITNLSVQDIDFDLTLIAGSAVGDGTDFGAAVGGLEVFDGSNWVAATSATIAAGEFAVQVRVPIIDDTIDEPDETYTLEVDVVAGTTTNLQVIGTGTIADNDAAPNVTIADATAVEGDGLVFDVTLSNPSSQPIVLNFLATDASATSASDYANTPIEYSVDGGTVWLPATNGTEVTIPAEQTAIKVRVSTTEDSVLETTETMQLAVASVVSGTVGNTSDTAIGTITDDDSALISITGNDPVAGEPANNGQFTVSMSNASDSPTVISYTITGPGTNGTDYSTISGSITLAAGSTSGLIDLTVVDDTLTEGDEAVVLTLTAITSGDADITIHPTDNTATVTIADDDEATWKLTGDATVNEDAIASYRLDLLGTLATGEAVSVDLSLTENTTNSADHATLASALASAVAAYSGAGSVVVVGTTVTFTSDGTGGMSQLVVEIATTNDAFVEGPEDFTVAISNPGSTTGAGVVLDAATSVTTTINDTIDAVGTSDDTAEWSITGPASAAEGTTAAYTVSLSAPLGLGEVATIEIGLSDGDTTSADYADFIAAVQAAADANPNVSFDGTDTLTFTAPTDGVAMTDLVINLGVVSDSLIEGPEDVRIALSNPGTTTGASIGLDVTRSDVTTTITDIDGPADWRLTGDTSVNEDAIATYDLDLLGTLQTGEVVSIDLGLTENSTNSADHDSLTTALTDAVAAYAGPGSVVLSGTTITFTGDGIGPMDTLVLRIQATNDAIVEGPEDYTLALANAVSTTGAAVSINSAFSVTTVINDTVDAAGSANDLAQWSIAGTTSVDEGATASYTISLDAALGLGESATIDLSLGDIDTTSSDYATLIAAMTAAAGANTDVTFDGVDTLTYTAATDGAIMTPLVVDLGITDDVILEGPEDFKLQIANPTSTTGATVALDVANSEVVTTINDTAGVGGTADGPAEWSIHGQTWADEGGTYDWTVQLDGAFGLNRSASVVIDLSDQATSPNDYADIHAAIALAIVVDSTLAYDSGTGTLTYTADSDGASMADLTFSLSITDDAWTEGPEDFVIGLSSAGSPSGLTTVGIDSANQSVTTVISDTLGAGGEPDGPAVWDIVGDTSVDEGAAAVYTISLTEQFGENETARIELTITNVDTNSSDYEAFATAVQDAIAADPTLSFDGATGILTWTSPSDGATMSDITLTLPIVDDTFTEGPEDYTISLTNPDSTTGANLTLPTASSTEPAPITPSVTTTIDDTQGPNGIPDTAAEWSLTGASTVVEGSVAQYTLALTGEFGVGETATVDFSLIDVDTTSSDYATLIATLTAAAATNSNITFDGTHTLTWTAPSDGASMVPLVINLTANDDSLIEAVEDLRLEISNATSTTSAVVVIDTTQDDVTTTITDNDSGEWSIAGDATVAEGSDATYTISLSGDWGAGMNSSIELGLTDNSTVAGDHDALLTLVQAAITASGRTDVDLVGNVLTFTSAADSSTMADLVFTIEATQDSTLEPNEDYDVTLSNATTTSGISVTLGDDIVNTVINDDADTSEVTITATTDGAETGPVDGLFTVSMILPSSTDTVINYTVSGTSNNGDHTLVNGTVTILAGATTATIAVPVIDDGLIEGVETAIVTLTSIASGDSQITIGTADNASIDIADNDSGEWSISGDATVNEGDDATYTITLSGSYGAGESTSITLGLTDNTTASTDHADLLTSVQSAITASGRTDIVLVGSVLTFTSSADNATMPDIVFTVEAVQDATLEANENYDVILSNPITASGISVTLGSDTVNTVINDDADTAEVTIAATTDGDETGPVDGLFTVSMTLPSSTDTVVNYTVSGTSNNGDHTLVNGTVTIVAGATTATIAVPVIDDGLTEGIETAIVTLDSIASGDSQITIGTADNASIDIADNDTGEWSITGDAAVNEGGDATYTIGLSGSYGAGESTSITVGLTDNTTSTADHADLLTSVQSAITASGRTDIVLVGNVLTFTSSADNATMPNFVFTVAAVQDSTLEANEDYDVMLSNPTTASGINVTLGNDTVNTVINDDADTAEVTIAATTDGDESGPVNGLFTVSMTLPSSTDTVINYTVSGTSNNGDHTLVNGTVTILAGETTATIAVPVIDDGLSEGVETAIVNLTSIASGDSQIAIGTADVASIDIADNDSGEWSIVGDASVNEGNDATYTIALSGTYGAGESTSITLSLTDNSTATTDHADLLASVQAAITASGRTDIVLVGSVLTFTSSADNASMADLLFTVQATNDNTIEANEDYDVLLSNPTTASGINVALGADTVNTVVNDDADTAEVTIAATTDGDETGPVDGLFTISMTLPSSTDTVINYTVAGTSNSGDHTLVSGSVTILAGDTSATMTVPVIDDGLVEGVEDVSVTLTSIVSADPQISIGTAGSATIEITDNDSGEWSITGDAAVNEGSNATYTMSLSGAYGAGENASISLGLADNTTSSTDHAALLTSVQAAITASGRTDVVLIGSVLTFTSAADSSTMAPLSFDILATQDSTLEANEDYDVTLAAPTNTSGVNVTLGNATVNTVINDDADTAEVTIAATTQAAESGPVDGLFTVTMTHPSSTDTVIAYSVAGASDSTDHSLVSGTVTILAGQTSATIAVPVIDDSIVEGTEDVTVQLTSITSGDPQIAIGTTDTDSLNITDNDTATWSLIGDTSVDEGGTAAYTLALAGTLQSGEVAAIDLAIGDGTTSDADYSSFVTAVQNAIGGRPELAFDATTGTLTYTSDGTALTDIVISLPIVDDVLGEGPEQYQVDILNTESATGSAVLIDAIQDVVVTTINDTQGDGGPADVSEWSMTGDASVDEGGSAGYVVALSGILQSAESAQITLTLTDIDTTPADHAAFADAVHTAIGSRSDLTFDSTSGLLTFTSSGAAMSPLSISLVATDDAFVEGPERYQVFLGSPVSTTGAVIDLSTTDNQVTTTINDTIGNNGATETAVWSLGIDQTVLEGDSGGYTLSLSGNLQAGEVVSVNMSLSDLDTTSGDYESLMTAVATAVNGYSGPGSLGFDVTTGIVTFTSDGSGPMTPLAVSLATVNDGFAEGVEDFLIRLTNASSSTGAATSIDSAASAVVTTIDDTSGSGSDDVEWSITGDVAVDEGASATYTIGLANTMQAGETATIDLAISDIDTTTVDYATFTTAVETAINLRTDLAFDVTSGTLTFTSQVDGVPMVDFVFSLSATDDAFVEGPELYTVSLLNPDSTTGVSTGLNSAQNIVATVINDTQSNGGPIDGPTQWSLTGAATVAEGMAAAYDINLTGNLQTDEVTSIQLTLTDMETLPADYDAFTTAVANAVAAYNGGSDPGSLNWDGTNLSFTSDGTGPMGTLTVSIAAVDDILAEGPERYRLDIANASSTTGLSPVISSTNNSVTTTITDDDSVTWSLTGDTSVDEGSTAVYTFSLDGIPQAGEQVSIEVALSDSTSNSSDYASFLNAVSDAAAARSDFSFDGMTGILTFTGTGSPMVDFVVDLAATDDNLIEGPEDFNVSISTPGSLTGVTVDLDAGDDNVTTTINDTQGTGGTADGPGEWNISGPTSSGEGTIPTYTVSLSGAYGENEVVTVDIALADLSTNSSDYDDVLAAIQTAADANPDVSFDASTGTLTYTASVDGATMVDLIIALPLTDDNFIEGPEQFQWSLSAAGSTTGANTGINNASVITTIDDTQGSGGTTDGPAQWSLTGPATTDEGATPQYIVSLSGAFGENEVVTVDLNLTDITTNASDYAAAIAAITTAATNHPDVTYDSATGTLTYTAPADGASMTPLLIDLLITDDVMIEGPEDFRFDLTNATTSTGANVSIDVAAQTVITTIQDTQGPGGTAEGPATWSIAGPDEVAEGTAPNYTVYLDGIFQADEVVSVDLGLTDNSTSPADKADLITQIAAAIAGNPDLTFNVTTGTLTYTAPSDLASMSPLVINLPITDDTSVESPEDFTIALSNPVTSSGAANTIDPSASEVTTIINGDPHVQDDIQHTIVGAPVSGNVLNNDTDPDGDPLTVTPTPVTPPANGTLVLNSNGSYTYTPNPDFRGIDSFEYEVCDDWGNCETATVTIAIADLSAVKQQTVLVPNGDNFDVTFEVKVENTGSTRMDSLTLFDDIASQFGATFLSISNVSLDVSAVSGTAPTLNSAWQNVTSSDILEPANTGEYLLPGESFILTYTVTMDPDAGGTSTAIGNQATVTGADISTLPGTTLAITDDSDSGTDATSTNPGAPGDTGGEDDITPLHIPDLGVAKQQLGTPVQQPDGSWNVDYVLIVENTGTTGLASPSLYDDVSVQFSTAWHGSSNFSIDTSGIASGTAPGLNTSWLTNPAENMLDGTGILKPGDFLQVSFTLNIDPDDLVGGFAQPMGNQATGGATALDGNGQPIVDANGDPVTTTDDSDSGSDPNGTNPDQPGDTGASNDVTSLVLPEIGIAKRIIGSAPSSTPGNFSVTYEAVIRNTGSVDLGNLTLIEDLENQLGTGFANIVDNPTIYASTATVDPGFNSNWDGNLDNVGDANMFDGISGLLKPGEQIIVQFTVEIDIDQLTVNSHNQMVAGGSYDETPNGSGFEGTVTDLSDAGSDPSGSNSGQTGDTGSTSDPTLIPSVGLAKQHGIATAAGPDNEDFSIPITLIVENLGPVEIGSLNLVDDVQTQFGSAFVSIDSLSIDISGVAGVAPGINNNWNGDGTNILDGTGTLQSGELLIVTFNVVIDPDATGTSSSLSNSASITASDANNPGLLVQDLSDSGTNPASTNPGDVGDNQTSDDATPLLIGDAGLAKQVTDISRNGIGFDLTVQFTLENTGTATLTNLQLHDDLMDQFGMHFGYVSVDPEIVSGNASVNPGINAAYADDTSQNIFDGTGELQPGESITVRLVVHTIPGSSGSAELSNSASGGGTAINPDGTPTPGDPIIDQSDSGSDPNGNNPNAPGDTGGTSDATSTSIQFYTYDAFNNFGERTDDNALSGGRDVERVLLTKQISALAPEPAFSGSARPGTRIVGRIYDSSGNLVAESMSLADVGGNWSMVMHNAKSSDHHRIEFVEIVGQGDTFGSYGDIYGYLGNDTHSNHYAALEPITSFAEAYTLGSVYRESAEHAIEVDHRSNTTPLGFGN